MAYREKRNIDQTTSIPLSRLATPSEISSYIKRLITASQYDYHETEAMEVQRVTLNEPGKRGSISGVFLNSGDFLEDVKPLFGNLTTVPVIGEHVTVTEFNGQFFYSAIINRKGSPNENSIPGASGTYIENTKYGKTFERKKVKPIEIGEGCIVFDGRFGQTLHFDGHDNTPKIKISTHVDESDGDFRKEEIDVDDSSIYVLSHGMRDNFDGQSVSGKKVLIQSDGIFIKGREEVRINGVKSINLKSENINIGKDANSSVIKGEELVNFLNDMLTDINTAFNKAMTAITPAGVIVTGGSPAIPIFATDILTLQTKLLTESNKFKSKIVKTI